MNTKTIMKANKSNLLIDNYPELVKSEWDYEKNDAIGLKPDEITSGMAVKAWWHCDTCNGSYEMLIYCKTRGSGCPFCTGKRVLAGFNDLASQYPDLVNSEWDWIENNKNGLKPYEIASKSNKKVWWHCNVCDGHYKMTVNNKTSGLGCPYCSGHQVLNGFNDLQTKYSELVESEWDYEKNDAIGLKPDEITSGSTVKANWHCNICKGKYEMRVNSKIYGHQGCPFCAGQKILKGFNDLLSQYPDLVNNEWDWVRNNQMGLKPDEIICGSIKKVWWHCNTCKGSYKTMVYNKTRGTGCPYCAGHKVLKGFNDLQSKYPELIKNEWDWSKNKIRPDEITYGSGIKAWWRCNVCYGKYEMAISIKTSGTGCPFCAGKQVLKGYNDLASQYPKLMNEWDYEKNYEIGLEPDAITAGSNKKVYWKCSQYGHSWNTTARNRINGTGCPKCSHHISNQENQVADFIRDYLQISCVNMNYSMYRSIRFKKIYEMKKINTDILSDNLKSHLRKELDIYIPELNIAVEYDGDYWHDDKIMLNHRGMTNTESHKIKQLLCKQAGIELLIITEHDWLSNADDVKNLIIDALMLHIVI